MSNVRNLFDDASFAKKPDELNRAGYESYSKSLEEKYLQLILTNQLGNTFYADRHKILNESIELHQAIFEKDPEFMAKALRYARNKGFMRTQTALGLSILSKNPAIFAKVFADIILIPDDLSDFMTMIKSQGRGEGGRAIHRAVSRFFNEKMTEYWAIKYASANRSHGYDLGDMLITHHVKAPKDDEVKQALFKYLVLRSAITQKSSKKKQESAKAQMEQFKLEKLHLLPQVEAYEKLKDSESVEEQINLITDGKLPMEVVTQAVTMTPSHWQALMKQMPITALIRNLETLSRHNVLENNREYIHSRITDEVALEKGKILPYNLLKAFNKVTAPWVKDGLRLAVEKSMSNIPDIPGQTAIFFDVSSSMWGDEMFMTGAIFTYALHRKTQGNGVAWAFNRAVYDMNPSSMDTILTQAQNATNEHAKSVYRNTDGTDTGAPVSRLISMDKKVDNIIIITDEQQNTGRPFYKEFLRYRNNLNRGTKAFIIDVSPYQNAVTPKEDGVYYIYGWSDKVLNFISMASEGFDSMSQFIHQQEL
ncbi:TROVE domain-containing protein [Paenibacillus pabuli]|uniref:TROVE domain-containing protein n=1 Tax=Paenibacillus pabuli TaxID=1472 RepID=UPI003242DEC8